MQVLDEAYKQKPNQTHTHSQTRTLTFVSLHTVFSYFQFAKLPENIYMYIHIGAYQMNLLDVNSFLLLAARR